MACEPYFVLAAWRPDLAVNDDDSATGQAGQAARFLADWTRRCLPLPLCSATSEHVFAAYMLWCRLQGITKPAPQNHFIGAARTAGFRNTRHRVNLHGAATVAQHTVLHPPHAEPLKSGGQLDRAVSAFAMSLAGWRQAAGGMASASPNRNARGQG